jgi:predicted amidohydrolase
MRLLLGQLAPVPGDVEENLARLRACVAAAPSDLAVFPELFLSGYRIGDRFHRLAVRPDDAVVEALRSIARAGTTTIVVGAPTVSAERPGELHNTVVVVGPDGTVAQQVKRYLPTFGPFEEGSVFTPTDASRPIPVRGIPVGFEICYDAFFPEVSRDLALAGAQLLVVLSASPVTSRRLFERLLPARAIENGVPASFANRVGVEDGIVFGGGSGAWDVRGEPVPVRTVAVPGGTPEESLAVAEIDPTSAARWRPFRPVLRDVATRPAGAAPPATRTRDL